ncbi:Uma2 family endonuclease [Gloeobacter violaceus]|uniref:Gll2616 protein n=1 Tax=Gloeobacter violaceus (strain ATCC 29082 / PCC 7421) TaxID=251221 RepID=Q7NHC1_GLOVI|nr:Uma2 family endonuclease [Gloeobacter violaceus]BAC90557.1 gll2616 [Gloeobacter violaceus PCC 7421]
MFQYDPLRCLPSSAELPDSDETPVDNELQDLVPALLRSILVLLWAERNDWFFAIDMGIYFDPLQPPVVPDGFLSVGVERRVEPTGRLSYVLWEENGTVPIFVLEVVSQTYRSEYDRKMELYRQLGVLYYAIYNPKPGRRKPKPQPLEVYKLTDTGYVLQPGEPVWLPELQLGLGRAEGEFEGWQREWLYWYDAQGQRLLPAWERYRQAEERIAQEQQRADQERQRAEQERQRAERLADYLRSRGIDPDALG